MAHHVLLQAVFESESLAAGFTFELFVRGVQFQMRKQILLNTTFEGTKRALINHLIGMASTMS